MVLAERIKLDILEDHHMVGAAGEVGVVDDLFHALAITAGQKIERLRHALRRFGQSLAGGIFAKFDQQLLDERRQLFFIRFFPDCLIIPNFSHLSHWSLPILDFV
jgi:hypothetical protein